MSCGPCDDYSATASLSEGDDSELVLPDDTSNPAKVAEGMDEIIQRHG